MVDALLAIFVRYSCLLFLGWLMFRQVPRGRSGRHLRGWVPPSGFGEDSIVGYFRGYLVFGKFRGILERHAYAWSPPSCLLFCPGSRGCSIVFVGVGFVFSHYTMDGGVSCSVIARWREPPARGRDRGGSVEKARGKRPGKSHPVKGGILCRLPG